MSFLLQQSGFRLLQQDGYSILIESTNSRMSKFVAWYKTGTKNMITHCSKCRGQFKENPFGHSLCSKCVIINPVNPIYAPSIKSIYIKLKNHDR